MEMKTNRGIDVSVGNWNSNRLQNLCFKIGSGATPRGGKESYLANGPYSLIRSQNVLDFYFSREGLAYINKAQALQLSNVEVKEKDVLLNITGDSVARVCQVPNDILPARVNQHVAIIRPDQKKLSPEYLKYYLLYPKLKNFMLAMASVGGTRNALTKGMIEDFEIEMPDLPTQTRIANILSALDEKIELNRQTNTTLEAIAQAIFKEWFVDFRFPGATREMQDSELGPIPKGWNVSTLKDLAIKIGSGATPRGGNGVYLDEGVALIRSQNVYDSEFVWNGLARISDDAAEGLRNVEVQPEDVLLNITGASILRTCVVDPQVLPARVNQHVAIIRPKLGIPSRYIHLYLLQPTTKSYLMGMNAGGSREAITKGNIESLPILNPHSGLLRSFEAITTPIYSEIEQLWNQTHVLSTIRDTILPKLMSGEIEV